MPSAMGAFFLLFQTLIHYIESYSSLKQSGRLLLMSMIQQIVSNLSFKQSEPLHLEDEHTLLLSITQQIESISLLKQNGECVLNCVNDLTLFSC
jgi:hypothetical protein